VQLAFTLQKKENTQNKSLEYKMSSHTNKSCPNTLATTYQRQICQDTIVTLATSHKTSIVHGQTPFTSFTRVFMNSNMKEKMIVIKFTLAP